MKTKEQLALPLTPEASLRECVSEIVDYFAIPVGMGAVMEPVDIQGKQLELPSLNQAFITGDTIAEKNFEKVCSQIYTQEMADPDLDEQQPHRVILHAHHKLGAVFAEITLPALPLLGLPPSEQQKGRPTITVDVKTKSKAQFKPEFATVMLNDLLGEVQNPFELGLIEQIQTLLRPVKGKSSTFQTMTDVQMQQLENLLVNMYWDSHEEREKIRSARDSRTGSFISRVLAHLKRPQTV